jgi:hypothetical protein
MRPPRYRFPDEVRSTTRSMAARMVREGTAADTPGALDAWIAERPEVREPLERGGYGSRFTAEDLHPLLVVFLAQAGVPPAAADAPAGSARRWLVWGAAAVAAVALLAFLASCASAPGEGADPEPPVRIHYEHVLTCTRFMGREGQFFVYRIVRVDNGGAAPFTLQPALLRFPGGAAPVLAVPEFSELEVAPGAREGSAERYLLERRAAGRPPRGALPLGYGEPGVGMVRGSMEPDYDQPRACDEYNT